MENYEQKYKEALERAKGAHNSAKSDKENSVTDKITEYTIQLTETIFPELKESEDEKMMNQLHSWMKEFGGAEEYTEKVYQWIKGLLEKQGKESVVTDVLIKAGLKTYKDGNKWCILVGDNIQDGICGFGDTVDEALFEFLKELVGKQGGQEHVVVVPRFRVGDVIRPKGSTAEYTIESISGECYHGKGWGLLISCDDDYELVEHKSDENVESKFKTGDWIVYCNEDVDLITSIEDDGYLINESGYIPFTCQRNMRLWEISDAKDGDVLYDNDSNTVLIFKSQTCGWVKVYCDFWTNKNKFTGTNPADYGRVSEMDLKPATKEQRDLLFSKMKEAGYEWSDKNRKLIKMK